MPCAPRHRRAGRDAAWSATFGLCSRRKAIEEGFLRWFAPHPARPIPCAIPWRAELRAYSAIILYCPN
eukprot:364612-Chlamydomonas_euryale.AAC.4